MTDEPLADSKLVYFTVEGDIAHQVYAQPAHKAGQTFLKFYFPKQDIAGWVVPARKHWGLISEDDIEADGITLKEKTMNSEAPPFVPQSQATGTGDGTNADAPAFVQENDKI